MQRARSPEAKAERFAQLIAAARTCFRRDGYDAMSMADLARCAGLAKGTAYLYVRSKEQLILHLTYEEMQQWAEDLRRHSSQLQQRPKLKQQAATLIDTLTTRPLLRELLALQPRLWSGIDEAKHAELVQLWSEVVDHITAWTYDCMLELVSNDMRLSVSRVLRTLPGLELLHAIDTDAAKQHPAYFLLTLKKQSGRSHLSSTQKTTPSKT